jgi:RHS repeat-associated protein
VIAEYRDGALAAQYVAADALDRPLQVATDGSELFVHTDVIGSVRLLTDTGGVVGRYAYGAFGEPTEESGQRIATGFAGRRRDHVTGDYDFRLRAYRPTLGRFLQRDPFGAVDGTNLYGYAGHNPLAFVDPTGAAAERATPGAPAVPDQASPSPPTSVAPPATESAPAPQAGGAPEVLLPADQWVEPKREPDPAPPPPGPAPPDEYFSRLVYNAEQWAKSSDDDYRGLRRGAAFLAELIFGLPLAIDAFRRARDEEAIRNSFADQLETRAARSTSGPEATRLREQAGRLRFRGFQETQAAAFGVVVAAVLRGRGRPVTRKLERYQRLGFQDHHIFTNKTAAVRDHPIWKAAGRDPDTRVNKMLLPSRPDLHPTRSIHRGRHDRGLVQEQVRTPR